MLDVLNNLRKIILSDHVGSLFTKVSTEPFLALNLSIIPSFFLRNLKFNIPLEA